MLPGRRLVASKTTIERSVTRHYSFNLQQLTLTPRVSHHKHNKPLFGTNLVNLDQQRRAFSGTGILWDDMSQSPSKKQKVSANANEHLEEEPHEMTSETKAVEKDRDPYPQGKDHESKGKHDTTTTHEDEEMEKRKEGGEWRDQPPYRTTSENEHFEKKHEAQCNCGRIKYWLSRDKPIASKYCHCKDCQSLHGAPLQWAAVFEKQDLHFENGAKGLAFYHSEKKHTYHDLPCKVSCAYCHAPIMDEGRNMVLMFPAIIKFKDEAAKKAFEPSMHIFYSRRCLDIKDGKPKWSELDEQSDLMQDVD